MASALFHMQEYELATRCYMAARNKRETTLGGDTIDCATVYNNLGVCHVALGRVPEAAAYFKLAISILAEELGANHPRVLTVARNITKTSRMNL
mmetsp:Transcript_16047/g.7675  ORF Transcript_16047/g.7675 Transcript_16047/m.7675 type:complete len:94 (+) Transcript_16047:270-551(+)